VVANIVGISVVFKPANNNIKANSKKQSLSLLKEYALRAHFKVATRVDQKLIKKKEVSPISSHPKKNIIRLPALTKKIILSINEFKNNKRRSTKGSYLK
jgi:hypothetical protein